MATSYSSDQTTLQKDTGAITVLRAARTRITSIQGKGIVPDIIVEQGVFESFDYQNFSEADLKDSLDKEDKNKNTEESPEEVSVIELPIQPLFADIDTEPAFGEPVHPVEATILISSIKMSL